MGQTMLLGGQSLVLPLKVCKVDLKKPKAWKLFVNVTKSNLLSVNLTSGNSKKRACKERKTLQRGVAVKH